MLFVDMLISSRKQLIKNLDRVEGYLSNGSDELYDAMARYIARGRVFVSYRVNGEYHFAPSRFVGYKDNTLVKHQNNQEKDGKKTTPAITHILGSRVYDSRFEKAYLEYCNWLGVEPSKHKRTFWSLDNELVGEFTSEPFREGGCKLRTHLVRERNNKVVRESKHLFRILHDGRLFCEVCGFDFSSKYGKIGDGFIEAHHKVEFSSIEGEHEILPSDFAMVCSNCHSMLHREGITISQLKKRLKK